MTDEYVLHTYDFNDSVQIIKYDVSRWYNESDVPDISTHQLQHQWLDVAVCYTFNVAIPDLQHTRTTETIHM